MAAVQLVSPSSEILEAYSVVADEHTRPAKRFPNIRGTFVALALFVCMTGVSGCASLQVTNSNPNEPPVFQQVSTANHQGPMKPNLIGVALPPETTTTTVTTKKFRPKQTSQQTPINPDDLVATVNAPYTPCGEKNTKMKDRTGEVVELHRKDGQPLNAPAEPSKTSEGEKYDGLELISVDVVSTSVVTTGKTETFEAPSAAELGKDVACQIIDAAGGIISSAVRRPTRVSINTNADSSNDGTTVSQEAAQQTDVNNTNNNENTNTNKNEARAQADADADASAKASAERPVYTGGHHSNRGGDGGHHSNRGGDDCNFNP